MRYGLCTEEFKVHTGILGMARGFGENAGDVVPQRTVRSYQATSASISESFLYSGHRSWYPDLLGLVLLGF